MSTFPDHRLMRLCFIALVFSCLCTMAHSVVSWQELSPLIRDNNKDGIRALLGDAEHVVTDTPPDHPYGQPLHWAVMTDDPDTMDLAFRAGGRVQLLMVCASGQTPFHIAARAGKYRALDWLCAREFFARARVDSMRDAWGVTWIEALQRLPVEVPMQEWEAAMAKHVPDYATSPLAELNASRHALFDAMLGASK